MATTPAWPANIPTSYETQNKTTPRILIAKFGDGYEQRSMDWLNNLPRTITVKVDQTDELVDQLVAFLVSLQGSTAFTFTPYHDTLGTFVADQGWTRTYKGYDYSILEVQIREVFELY